MGLDISPAANALLGDLQTDMGQHVIWTRPQNLHLTIRYLGQIGPRLLGGLDRVLSYVQMDTFSLKLRGVGSFQAMDQADTNVLWVGVEPSKDLQKLFLAVNQTLVRLGVPPSGRPFMPHITLARIKNGADPEQIRSFLERHRHFEGALYSIDQFNIYESRLGDHGLEYAPLKRYKLGLPTETP